MNHLVLVFTFLIPSTLKRFWIKFTIFVFIIIIGDIFRRIRICLFGLPQNTDKFPTSNDTDYSRKQTLVLFQLSKLLFTFLFQLAFHMEKKSPRRAFSSKCSSFNFTKCENTQGCQNFDKATFLTIFLPPGLNDVVLFRIVFPLIDREHSWRPYPSGQWVLC